MTEREILRRLQAIGCTEEQITQFFGQTCDSSKKTAVKDKLQLLPLVLHEDLQIVVKDYSDKCFAVFGDYTQPTLTIFKMYFDCRSFIKFNAHLAFGPGYIIPKYHYDIFMQTLHGLPHKIYTRAELTQELTPP